MSPVDYSAGEHEVFLAGGSRMERDDERLEAGPDAQDEDVVRSNKLLKLMREAMARRRARGEVFEDIKLDSAA